MEPLRQLVATHGTAFACLNRSWRRATGVPDAIVV
jgi:hypothetical protein